MNISKLSSAAVWKAHSIARQSLFDRLLRERRDRVTSESVQLGCRIEQVQ